MQVKTERIGLLGQLSRIVCRGTKLIVMNSRIRILSINIGLKSDLAGLLTLISVHRLDLIMMQEVRITDEQINQQLGNHGFTGMVNIDAEDPFKPGTALAWRSTLPIREVSSVVPCRVQHALLRI